MKRLITICAVVGMVLAISSVANAIGVVNSGGWARVDYNIALPVGASGVSEYQHTRAEAGFDIASGTAVEVSDDYAQPHSYADASAFDAWGEGEADTSEDYLSASNYATADISAFVPESWGYGLAIYRLSFTLGTEETIDIGYIFSGNIWADSFSAYGSAFSVGLLSIWIDDPGMVGDPAYDSDPNCDAYVEVIGSGFASKDLSDSGTISHVFDAGEHEIALFVDTYENAAVPEPATMCLLGLGALSLLRRKRKA